MSRRKPATPEIPEGPNPDRGGAFIRLPDGSLARDDGEEQFVPEDEGTSAAGALAAPEPGSPLQLPPLTQDASTNDGEG